MPKKTSILSADFETTTLLKNENESYLDFRERLKKASSKVYSWAICERLVDHITNFNKDNYKINDGLSVFSFLEFIDNIKKDTIIFFHNGAKFDLHFILPYLDFQGYKQLIIEPKNLINTNFDYDMEDSNILIEQKTRLLEQGEYSILVDKSYKILEMKICIKDKKRTNKKSKNRVVIFRDSNLMFPSALKDYGVALNKKYKTKDFTKIELKDGYLRQELYKDYEEFLKDKNEREYLHMDTIILNEFLHLMNDVLPFQKWKLTSASTAYSIWKYDFFGKDLLEKDIKNPNGLYRTIKKNEKFNLYVSKKSNKIITYRACINRLFNKIFPTDWLDTNFINLFDNNYNFIHNAYQGGLAMANGKYAGKKESDVVYVDINSSYPTQMIKQKFPYGKPFVGDSKNKEDIKLYNVSIEKITNTQGLPFLYSFLEKTTGKHYPKTIKHRDYLLTDIEFKNLQKYYKGEYTYDVAVSFNSKSGEEIFGSYVKKFYELKKQAKINNNVALGIYSKLMLNSLYGKFGQDVNRESKLYFDNSWFNYETLNKANFYLPIAVLMTSYARMYLVDAVGFKYKNILGLDTDSLSIKIPAKMWNSENNEIVKYLENNYAIEINKEKLGYWDIEHKIKYIIFRRAKQYYFIDDNDHKTFKVAGLRLNNEQLNKMNFEDFVMGVDGLEQLRPFRTPTGLILETYEKKLKPVWKYSLNPDYWFTDKESFEHLNNSTKK